MKSFLKSFVYAINGIKLMFIGERNFYVHVLAAVIAIFTAFYFPLTLPERAIIVLMVSVVLSAEIINSSIEKLVDLLHPQQGKKAGDIKDMAAGAVLVLAVAALIVAVIIFLPYFKVILL